MFDWIASRGANKPIENIQTLEGKRNSIWVHLRAPQSFPMVSICTHQDQTETRPPNHTYRQKSMPIILYRRY